MHLKSNFNGNVLNIRPTGCVHCNMLLWRVIIIEYTIVTRFILIYHIHKSWYLLLYYWARWVTFKKQERLILREHLVSPPSFLCGPCYSLFKFLVLSYWVSFRSEFCVVMSVTISAYKWCLVHLYLQLFVGGLMFYLRYLCLCSHSCAQFILCCVVSLFCFVRLCCHFLWIVQLSAVYHN